MREVELKAAVPDPDALRARLAAVSAELVFAGALVDVRYDTADGSLVARDHLLRVRTMRDAREGAAAHTTLDWKGPTEFTGGYKVREELVTDVGDHASITATLAALGYVVVREIERDIEQYHYAGATLRLERYPRLDVLLEVEGTPESIERAIAATGLARTTFSAQRLSWFVDAFEARTGVRAALSARELDGDWRYRSGAV